LSFYRLKNTKDMINNITSYLTADYPGAPTNQEWNIEQIDHNIDSDCLRLKINAINQPPEYINIILLYSVSKFMSDGYIVIKDNILFRYTYLSEEDKNNLIKEHNYLFKECQD